MKQIKILSAIIIFTLSILANHNSFSQEIHGVVYEANKDGSKSTLPGVNIYWAGTTVGTATDVDGNFHLKFTDDNEPHLVISYIGYQNDTMLIDDELEHLDIVLAMNHTLNEVVIVERIAGSHISRTNPIISQIITSGELQKAACCNLSESFETNASVDVAYSDAVSGAKQIKLLGLDGKYSQIQTENIPNLRGLGTSFGLGYVPGSWMESIQVSKGTASVKNGYESITGQINIEYKKPDNSEKLFLNLYGNHLGKLEGNVNSAKKINDRWSTAIFAHAENNSNIIDNNDDSFLDQPLVTQYNFLNRWKYENGKNIHAQFGIKYINEERTGGQKDFDTEMERTADNPYGTNVKTNRVELFSKTAYIFTSRPATNMAFVNSFIYHDMNSYFGLTDYDAIEYNYYGNLMFQSYIGTTSHSYTTGISYVFDQYNEQLNDSAYKRIEHVPGGFFEYTYVNPEKFTLLFGMRADYNNLFGLFFTPRFHFKYNLTSNTIMRASAGKGYRTPNAIAENLSLLASSRRIVFVEELKMENAWNYGVNLTQYINIDGKELSVNIELYRTDFINQAIIDKDQDIPRIFIYNLDGKSYSNSFQIESKYELISGLDVTAAFRWNDVKMTIDQELIREPLVHKYKGLLGLSYVTRAKKWQIDVTTQFNGDSRIPSTEENPQPYKRDDESPAYTILNAQVTKFFKSWDFYVGGENLTNYTQDNPIIASDDPFGPYFDASNIWGPLVGIKVYAGVRLKIN